MQIDITQFQAILNRVGAEKDEAIQSATKWAVDQSLLALRQQEEIDRLRAELVSKADELAAAIKQRDEATSWIACQERLPQPGQAVLVAVGKNVLRAMHAPHLTLSEDDYGEFQPQAEYDEATDRTYWPEGWYECNAFEETHWRVERDPTHWMPLPQPPREKEGGGA